MRMNQDDGTDYRTAVSVFIYCASCTFEMCKKRNTSKLEQQCGSPSLPRSEEGAAIPVVRKWLIVDM